MSILLIQGTINAADYNPQQGFDGSPISWPSFSELNINQIHFAADALKARVQFGSRDGSDYAYFWFNETPDDIYGPGDLVEVYTDGTVKLTHAVVKGQ